MTEDYVEQAYSPRAVKARLEKLNCQQTTLAELMGISDAALSFFLTGRSGLSIATQESLMRGLRWMEAKAEEAEDAGTMPPDFNRLEIVLPLWRAHRRACSEAEVLRLAGEIRAREEVKS